jgi:hypothetical protein
VNNLWDYRPGVWDYRESTWTLDRDLVRYDVQATDGCIGKVERAASDAAGAYVVVDLGSWVPGRKRLIPAGAIAELDHGRQQVHIALTREDVREAPDYDPDRWDDEERTQHARYYAPCLSA